MARTFNIIVLALALVANASAATRGAAKPPPSSWTGTIDTGKSLTSTAESAAQDADEEPDLTSVDGQSTTSSGGNPDTPPTEGSAPGPDSLPSLAIDGHLAHFSEYDGCNDAINNGCGMEHPCMSKSDAEQVLLTFGAGDFCGSEECGSDLSHPCEVEDIMMGMSPIYKSVTKSLDSISRTTADSEIGAICVFDDSVAHKACTIEDLKQNGFPGVFAEFDGCNDAINNGCGMEHPCMSKSDAEQILLTFGAGDFCGSEECGSDLSHPCEVEDIMVGFKPIYKSASQAAQLLAQSSSSSSMPYTMLAGVAASALMVGAAINAVFKRRGMIQATASPAYTPV